MNAADYLVIDPKRDDDDYEGYYEMSAITPPRSPEVLCYPRVFYRCED